MTRLALLLALWPSWAGAQTSHAWGDGDTGPCRVEIRPCAGDCAAEIVFANRLVVGPGVVEATLALPGLTVAVRVDTERQDVPDVLVVTPPVGFYADPPSLIVGEGETAIIRVRPVPVG